jgi:hypothetical protein
VKGWSKAEKVRLPPLFLGEGWGGVDLQARKFQTALLSATAENSSNRNSENPKILKILIQTIIL